MKGWKKLYKIFLLAFIYIIPISIGLNLFILLKYKNNSNSAEKITRKLYELEYYRENAGPDPYKGSKIMYLHPTNYFSFALKSKDRNNISNKIFSLNDYGYRNNPFFDNSSNPKKCILYLGGSTAFGLGASSDAQTLPALLNKQLGSEYRVYNLAVSSWNSRQELNSLISFFYNGKNIHCKTIDSISLTSSNDVYTINNSMQSPIFEDQSSRRELIGAPENFDSLKQKVDSGTKAGEPIYHFRMLFKSIVNLFFGEIIYFANDIYQYKFKGGVSSRDNLSLDQKKFIEDGISSLFVNQKLINDLVVSSGGKHLVVFQPNMLNHKPKYIWWDYGHKQITKEIKNNSCLSILDLRFSLIEQQPNYQVNTNVIPLTLEESILSGQLKREEVSQHLFFDGAHFTDLGHLKLSDYILQKYRNLSSSQKCLTEFLTNQ